MLLTAFVVMATANHYLLDVVAGAVLVWITVALMAIVVDRPGNRWGERLGPADAFFLYAESPAWPQHVGGMVVMDDPDPDGYRERLRTSIRDNLDSLPRFRQRLQARSGWRRPRWQDIGDFDWDWHTPAVDLAGGGSGGARRLRRPAAAGTAAAGPPTVAVHHGHRVRCRVGSPRSSSYTTASPTASAPSSTHFG